MNAIEVQDLKKAYNAEATVLKNMDFTVKEGEFFAIVGPSGCGKSTLLRIIAGLEQVTDGMLMMNGQEATYKRPDERNISMVFQNYALFPHMTVAQNITFGLHVKKISKEEQKKRCMDAAQLLGLQDLLERKPRELSGGQRQRVALGRAIASQAPICLMDEPLSNLDAKLRSKMRSEVRQIQRRLGMTMIYVTHDQIEAMTMADRMMVLNGGDIQQIGDPLHVYNHPENKFVATFIGSPPMNMIEATLNQQVLQITDEWQLSTLAIANNKVYVGVRPEHIAPAGSDKPSFLGKVEHVEILGTETLIMFSLNGEQWIAKWAGQWNFQAGEQIPFKVDTAHLHLFDFATEKRIEATELLASMEVTV
ncbi:ABC transporter ATP-binding protein [Metasolibacillus sp.]|uniref:ABC transporter ATP-binding protein n=1 Tax=Metasolibacillus sp. TaxID=2703680 RepID=UPI0025F9C04C|nr:ABC transporter ATP-binding protein [Metasolibacillus sp.]MCT6924203.1 ABC transporter ATP-binding protein [Metasolibacillus sp.]MCT6940395.1 ABC transporter ATP-binding protein [Metasolibacillus sp.]